MSSALTMSLISSCDELICTPSSESTLLILNLFAIMRGGLIDSDNNYDCSIVEGNRPGR